MSIQEYINHQWETGDKVVSEYYGLGEVIEILPCDEPNIRVKFTNGIIEDFYRNGDSIKTNVSSREGIKWYNESRGIQHCLVVDDAIHTANLEDEDYHSTGEIWYSYNHELDTLYSPKKELHISDEIKYLLSIQQ